MQTIPKIQIVTKRLREFIRIVKNQYSQTEDFISTAAPKMLIICRII